LASLGHTDYIVIADKGYPVPQHKERINLAITDDLPTVLNVLDAIEKEFMFDRIIVTEEMEDISPERLQTLKQSYPHVIFEKVTHSSFKEMTQQSNGVIKTGDSCPYGNIIIVSGD